MAPATSGWAIASLVSSIAGLCTGGLASIAGVICGHIALSEIGAAQGRVEGRSLAIAGLVIGYTVIALHLLLILAFIAAIVASGPLR